jgi:hypothetical protein
VTSQDLTDRGRPRKREPVGSPLTRAKRVLTDRRHRTAVVFGALAMIALIAFGVYAVLAGRPPQVEGVVYFVPDASAAQKEAVRAACPTVGKAVQEPPDHNNLDSSRTYPLRYNFTAASTVDKAAVYRCVQRQPGVMAISEYTDGQ